MISKPLRFVQDQSNTTAVYLNVSSDLILSKKLTPLMLGHMCAKRLIFSTENRNVESLITLWLIWHLIEFSSALKNAWENKIGSSIKQFGLFFNIFDTFPFLWRQFYKMRDTRKYPLYFHVHIAYGWPLKLFST